MVADMASGCLRGRKEDESGHGQSSADRKKGLNLPNAIPWRDGRRNGNGGFRMDSRHDDWVEEERIRWRGLVETEWESFDTESAAEGWVFDDDGDPESGADCDKALTVGPSDSSETILSLSRSLATAFLIADIGIRLTCLDHLLDGDLRGGEICESLGRFYITLCHSVEQNDRWRVETSIECLRERLQPVAGFSNECAAMIAELESLLRRLHVRCVPASDDTDKGAG